MFQVKDLGEFEILEPIREGIHFWDKYTQKSISDTKTVDYDLGGLSKEYSFFYHLPMIIKMGIDPAIIFRESHIPSSDKDVLIKIELDKNYYQPLKEEKIGKNGNFIFGCINRYAKWLFQYLELICVKERQISELDTSKMYRVIHLEQKIRQQTNDVKIAEYTVHNFTLFNDKFISFWDKESESDNFKFQIIENIFKIPENRINSTISANSNIDQSKK